MSVISRSPRAFLLLAMLAGTASAGMAQQPQQAPADPDPAATVYGEPAPEAAAPTKGPRVDGIISARSGDRMQVTGADGFEMQGASSLKQISRDPLDLVAQACGPNHQYPDGFMLFLGTMFAPTQDRFGPGQGFTHAVGDVVTVSTPGLGTLANRVNHSDKVAPWTYGMAALMRDLSRRGLIN